jgi:glycosyltransferase involved in cell wall biosynthesis
MHVARQRTNVWFLVAGDGVLLEELRRRCAPLGTRVLFLGWRRDVGTVYSAADAVVLTSDNEGMPVSLIEAAMCERPAVTTDVGSAREVVINDVTGFVTSSDPVDIGAALVRLLDDASLSRSMGKSAAERARAVFGTRRLVVDIGQIYDELALEKRFT